jgi:uracil-DNA glycosylase family protein
LIAGVDPGDAPVVTRQAVATGDATLPEVRRVAAGCQACELWARATQTVFGEGPVPARLMLVGEQPGDREDRIGRPFVGPAGRILDDALERAGIDRASVFVTNVVKHFRWRPAPGSKRRLHERPTKANVSACLPWVESELALVQPAALVLLGATAVAALAGPDVRLTRDRGRPLASTLAPRLVVTIHPSAILRARGDRDALIDGLASDLRVAADTEGGAAA